MSHLESVDNALQVLILLGQGRVKVTEVARELGVAPSTAHRLLGTIVRRGFARQLEDRSYQLVPAVGHLVPAPKVPAELMAVCRLHLPKLAHALGEPIHVVVLRGHQPRLVLSLESTQHYRGGSSVERSLDAHLEAARQCLLADLSPSKLAATLPPGTTAAEAEALRVEVETVRHRGYAVSEDATRSALVAVAVPVVGSRLRSVAAITVSVPPAFRSQDRMGWLVAQMRDTASALAADLITSANEAEKETAGSAALASAAPQGAAL